MTVGFLYYYRREHVAAMLEAPVRQATKSTAVDVPVEAWAMTTEAWGDIRDILSELDRIDTVEAAKSALRTAERTHDLAVLAEYAKVTDAPAGTECTKKNVSGGRANTWRARETISHKAKYLLNGEGYCGTHLQRSLDFANYKSISDHKAEYIEDAALRKIVDDDRELRDCRRQTGTK